MLYTLAWGRSANRPLIFDNEGSALYASSKNNELESLKILLFCMQKNVTTISNEVKLYPFQMIMRIGIMIFSLLDKRLMTVKKCHDIS